MEDILENETFKAPSVDPEFNRYWDLFIGDVTARENFKPGHLEQLAILCRMYMEFYALSKQIDERGAVYENDSPRYGITIKVHPATTIRDKTIAEIRHFSKMLGLILVKDSEMKDKPKKSEWD